MTLRVFRVNTKLIELVHMFSISQYKQVVFVKTPVPKLQDDRLEPDMGLLYVASYLKRNAPPVDTVYVDLSVDSISVLLSYLRTCKVFCFSTFTANYYLTKEIVGRLREKAAKDTLFIAGGHHASALPDEVSIDFDYVIVGEGEIAMTRLYLDLLQQKLPLKRIIYGECIKNLDDAGWIDYSMVKMDCYTRRVNGRKSISILTSRGCPYSCNFCNSYLMKSYKSVRFRSAKDVTDEILYLNTVFGINSFRIQDDIFSINKARLKELAERLGSFRFTFRCFARIDNIDEETIGYFKKIGVFHLSFGIESGSQKILDLMNKGITVNQIREGMKLVKKHGFKRRVYLIVGYPGETEETIDETIKLIRDIQPDDISIYPLIPYPGTPLFHHPEQFNITYINTDFSNYYQIFGDKDSGFVFETKDMNIGKLKLYRQKLVDGLADVCPWAIDDKSNR